MNNHELDPEVKEDIGFAWDAIDNQYKEIMELYRQTDEHFI
eukprot:CAMPEP_0176379288 /NCGR_PEP_ID=MMETSP0126-20121128/30251_1 /TAXON_ID=141414 ORGANISM="Strombidinopsis acuminatum, Strain SPMC142" /NCGR_SAMPLE_ID=MMETSP0126 /ASSEMBLY_ACC=CAM_ASM_000229 /LENGTH=40 /DNA_ID= /DNA_START= /DNA_END= /DNA_ORIENTATION=